MSLTVHLKNIGILKQADFSLGDITIICGKNNTGKTYTAYALYGFLQSWRSLTDFQITNDQVRKLLTEGSTKIELSPYLELANQMLPMLCERYHKQLDKIFAAEEGTFQNSEFHIETSAIQIQDEGFRAETGIKPRTIYYHIKGRRK